MSLMLSCHCLALRRATRAVSNLYDAALAPAGLTVAQFAMLQRLRALGPVNISHAAQAMQLDRTTLGRNLGPLERDAMIRIIASETDGRQRVIVLTDRGRQAMQQAIPAWKSAQAAIETRFDGARLALLHDLLAELETAAAQPAAACS